MITNDPNTFGTCAESSLTEFLSKGGCVYTRKAGHKQYHSPALSVTGLSVGAQQSPWGYLQGTSQHIRLAELDPESRRDALHR